MNQPNQQRTILKFYILKLFEINEINVEHFSQSCDVMRWSVNIIPQQLLRLYRRLDNYVKSINLVHTIFMKINRQFSKNTLRIYIQAGKSKQVNAELL